MKISAKNTGNTVEVFFVFLKLGCTSFGGPIAHLGYFHKEFVERRKWVTESQFGQLLAICQFLPGPASSQLGFSLGLSRAGWLGAVAAFLAFTLPSAFLLITFAALLPMLAGPVGQAVVHGLKIVAFAVVADAVLVMGKKLCPDIQRLAIALIAAVALLLVANTWAQLLIVAGGAIAGGMLCRSVPAEATPQIYIAYGKKLGAVLLLLFFTLLFLLPLLSIQLTSSNDAGLLSLADGFYRAGALVFGGGHVVLPLLEDSAVASGWVTSEVFLAGYGASQAVPGPMFAFAAYLGALVPSGQAAWLGAAIALLFVFLPGFLLVAGVLPFWRAVSHNSSAKSAIAGVNAAVVGLLAAALYNPIFTTAIQNVTDMAVAIIGFSMLYILRWSALLVVAWCVIASLLLA
ncbi:MAG: chromate transporter [Pseudohongiellaceae bacterium]|jgi:chromate transporter